MESYAALHRLNSYVSPEVLKLNRALAQEQQNAERIEALLRFLKLDDEAWVNNSLGRVGKDPEWLAKSKDGGTRSHGCGQKLDAEFENRMKKAKKSRASKIDHARKRTASLSPEEVENELKEVFNLYVDKRNQGKNDRQEMDVIGWCRLLRDCRLFDNKFGITEADVVFSQVDAAADASSIPKDMHIDYQEFRKALLRLTYIKYPSLSNEEEAVNLIVKNWVLPFYKPKASAQPADMVFSRSCLNLLRRYDKALKRVYSWYCTLPETEQAKTTWEFVRQSNISLCSSDFVLFLLTFKVQPTLISKHEAVELFTQVEANNDGDEQADRVLYPAFLQCVAQVAIAIGDHIVEQLKDKARTTDELRTMKQYISCFPPSSQASKDLLAGYHEALAARGREAVDESGNIVPTKPTVAGYQKQIDEMKRKADEVERQNIMESKVAVLQRREGTRQKFALTRLQNTSKDLRRSSVSAEVLTSPTSDGTSIVFLNVQSTGSPGKEPRSVGLEMQTTLSEGHDPERNPPGWERQIYNGGPEQYKRAAKQLPSLADGPLEQVAGKMNKEYSTDYDTAKEAVRLQKKLPPLASMRKSFNSHVMPDIKPDAQRGPGKLLPSLNHQPDAARELDQFEQKLPLVLRKLDQGELKPWKGVRL